jgi:hypothetical protein
MAQWHSSITLTLDLDGHLLPQGNCDERIAAGELALVG